MTNPSKPNPEFTDKEFMLWLADAIEHMDHTLAEIKRILVFFMVITVIALLLNFCGRPF